MAGLLFLNSSLGWALDDREDQLRASESWKTFQETMERIHQEERTEGISYIVSGALVTVGGLAGTQNSNDPGSKLIFGLSESLGVAGMGYGIAKLSYGNEYNSFYESLKTVSLTPAQRDELVRNYMLGEREKQRKIREISLFTFLLIGALNAYSAAKESDQTAKTVYEVFAGVNLAVGVAFAF